MGTQVEPATAALRMRLMVGTPLTLGIVGLLLLDGYLSTPHTPAWVVPGVGIDLGRWLCNGALCTALIGTFVWLTVNELLRLARALEYNPFAWLAKVGATGLVVGPYVVFNSVWSAAHTGEAWGLFWLALIIALAFWVQSVRHGTNRVMVNIATTMFIVVYAGGLGHFMCRLRMEVGGLTGAVLLLFSLLVVKITDVGAYLTGQVFGRHKMIPWLSPKKTWEGLTGGLLIAIGCAVGVGYALHGGRIVNLPGSAATRLLSLLFFGILMAGLSTAGDLCASLLKRDAAVKDSGEALPGFGGILDVIDSPLLAAPAAWWFWVRLMGMG